MEKAQQQQQWWRAVKSRLSYKNATFVVCSFNIITVLLLFQPFFYSPPSNLASSQRALFRHKRECENIRRAFVPVDLIQRVREIGQDMHVETEQVQQKVLKQTAAVDLISRLNNFRSGSEAGSTKALEEWRKRKMERARQRSLANNGKPAFAS